MKKALVIGANGFIGKALVEQLQAYGISVITYGRRPYGYNSGENQPFERYIQGNFVSETRWNDILENVDVCFHLVSTTVPKTSNESPFADVSDNVLGTLRLLDALKYRSIRIVFASSGGTVYGHGAETDLTEDDPTNPMCSYGITKLTIEKYLALYHKLYDLDPVVLRLANPYGQGQSPTSSQGAIAVFMGRILSGSPIEIWGKGDVIRDYLYISDVVQAFVAAATYKGQNRVFNIGSGIGLSLLDVVATLETSLEKKATLIFRPPRSFDVLKNVLDIRLAATTLGWRPQTSFMQGIELTTDWMRQTYYSL